MAHAVAILGQGLDLLPAQVIYLNTIMIALTFDIVLGSMPDSFRAELFLKRIFARILCLDLEFFRSMNFFCRLLLEIDPTQNVFMACHVFAPLLEIFNASHRLVIFQIVGTKQTVTEFDLVLL